MGGQSCEAHGAAHPKCHTYMGTALLGAPAGWSLQRLKTINGVQTAALWKFFVYLKNSCCNNSAVWDLYFKMVLERIHFHDTSHRTW